MRMGRRWAGARRLSARGVVVTVGLVAAGLGAAPSAGVAATGVWGTPSDITGAPGGVGSLSSISCVAVADCTAVGSDGNGQPFYVSESGGVWGPPSEITGTAWGSSLNSVSCVGAGECTAVGPTGNGQPFYVHETGGAWSPAVLITGTPGGRGDLYGVSCVDASDCTAVGYDGNGQPLYVSESGGIWGPPTEIAGAPGGGGILSSVSCADAGDCTAVGHDGNGQPSYVTESGGAWGTPTEITGPAGIPDLYGVSCADASDCSAVGMDGSYKPFYVSESGGVWGPPAEVAGAPGGSGQLDGVSCVGVGDCTAVGYGAGQPFYVSESGGVWGPWTLITGAPDESGILSSVSCVGTEDGGCTAVGRGGPSQPLYVSETMTPSLAATSLSTVLDGGGRQSSTQLVVAPGTGVRAQAALSGTNTASAAGAVTYSVYSDPGCSIPAAPPETIAVTDGAIPASAPVDLAEGTYWWVTSYSGDLADGASQSVCGSQRAIVLSPSKFGADVATNLDVQPGAIVQASTEFEINVTVTNYGLELATNMVAGLLVPRALSVVEADGATERGGLWAWHPGTFRAGQTITYHVWVTPSPNVARTATIDAGALSLGTRDPAFRNNFVADQLTFAPVNSGRELGVRRVRFSDRQLRSRLRAAGHAPHQRH